MPAQAHHASVGTLPSEDEIRDDPRACYRIVRRRIEALRAAGEVVPDVLNQMERVLQVECMAQSQGR